jgi:hypothetical protein
MSMKLKMPTLPKMGKVLNDKNVLYIVFILAILNILGYLLAKNTEAIAFFLIVGFLTTYFSKNMIVVLLVAMISTSIFTSTRMSFGKIGMSKEGMENKEKKSDDDSKKDDTSKDEKDKDDKKDNVDHKEGFEKKPTIAKKSTSDKKKDSKDEVDGAEEPKKTNKSDVFVSQAENLENAYKNLEGMIGKDGINGLTSQTETLLKNQTQLLNNIKGMEPFIASAENLMNKLDLSSLDGIGSMLSNIGGKKE